ncbi:MAG: response regulator [Candidatus Neomarinimicrobiota bacterium]
MAADKKKTVLIVDSEEEVVSAVTERLEKRGMNVIGAADGIQGLNMARSKSPDLILLEVLLPKLDGYHVCRLLKFDQRFRQIPIIIVTAKRSERDEKVGLEAGADKFLSKPFKISQLLPLIDELIGSE